MNYYHYTSESGAQGIRTSGVIRKSNWVGRFTPGVYLVTMSPHSYSRDEILQNNYGARKWRYSGRADWAIQVPASSTDTSRLSLVSFSNGRDFYNYPDEIAVKEWQIQPHPEFLSSSNITVNLS